MKRILSISLILCLLLSFAACSAKPTDLSSADDTVTTTITTRGGEDLEQPNNTTDNVTDKATDNQTNNKNPQSDETKKTTNKITVTEDNDSSVATGATTAKNTAKNTAKRTYKATTRTPLTEAPITIVRTTRTTVTTIKKDYATDRKLKIACVGDSITAQNPAYWSQVHANISTSGKTGYMQGYLSNTNYEVKGYGVSGATALFKGVDYVNSATNGPKAYVDQPAYENSLKYGADIVVIMLGTNDSKNVNWPYYGDEFLENYIRIIRSYQDSASKPMVFVALPPTVYSENRWQGISNPIIEQEIIPALREAAAVTGAIVIDTHTATKNAAEHFSDGVHPSTPEGKALIGEAIAKAIIKDTGRS